MRTPGPQPFSDPERLVDALIERLGRRIVLALPLGLGKACHLANVLFDRARADPGLSLTILTALTLEAPKPGSELGRRFLDPIQDRFFGGYPALHYARDLRQDSLPANIEVHEFFLAPGRWLNQPRMQQAYQCANYSQVLALLLESGVNLIGQLVAPAPGRLESEGESKGESEGGGSGNQSISLSCNPDLTVDLLRARAEGQIDFIAVAQVNSSLPYMHGEALWPVNDFDYLLEGDAVQFPLFALPQEAVLLRDHAIGLNVARLIPDGGSLQIGIGSISDAVCHALVLRQCQNREFRSLLEALELGGESPHGCRDTFEEGLYGVSEMLVEGFLALIDAGVLKREVDGVVLHAGFFLGSPRLYRRLRELTPAQRDRIAMMPISFTNTLYPDPESKREARVKARFVNSAMMATLSGAVISDGLENGQVVSGVGGQFDFAAMAASLPGARSIITLSATRIRNARPVSNIRWNYGHCTLPRHLRDLLVTEYGVADLRGVSDSEVIKRMLAITDSRFQGELLEQAKSAGKIAADYRIPTAQIHNTPERLAERLTPAYEQGLLPTFPLGSDFTPTEERLVPALKQLSEQSGSRRALARLALKGLRAPADKETAACLERMGLEHPSGLREYLYRALLRGALVDL